MNWNEIEGKWKRLRGSAQERWGKLTDDDWQTIAGKSDDVYIDYNDGYYLYDRRYPGTAIDISVVL